MKHLPLALCAVLFGATTALASDGSAAPVQVANPSATFCIDQGGEYEIRTEQDGSQIGICILPDGTEQNAWEYFHAHAPKGD